MPAVALAALVAAAIGVALLVGGWLALRASGARAGLGRRLAGATEVKVGRLLDIGPGGELPLRPVRVVGRIRCGDPLVTAEDDRLVAFHRDVEVQMPRGGWRTIERLRESRSFELWDHDGSLTVDPAGAAEPLVVLPHVWEGPAAELGEPYRPAVDRITAELGTPPEQARSVTRMVSVVERLLVLAEVRRRPDGAIALVPPPGGFVISGMELDEAMRLLGGGRPRLLLAGTAGVAAGVLAVAVAALLLLVGLVAGG